jgi:hypothetical protein
LAAEWNMFNRPVQTVELPRWNVLPGTVRRFEAQDGCVACGARGHRRIRVVCAKTLQSRMARVKNRTTAHPVSSKLLRGPSEDGIGPGQSR